MGVIVDTGFVRILLVLVTVVLSIAGCKKAEVTDAASGEALVDDAIASMRGHRDKICACETSECSESAFEEYKARAKENLERLDRVKAKANKEQGALMESIAKQMGACVLSRRTPKR